VRIAELSRRSGVPVATIKYYLRERLLPPGVHTHRNQVDYNDGHVTRLRLIKALMDIGGLSTSATSELLAVLDSADLDAWESVGKAQYAVSKRRAAPTSETIDAAAGQTVDALLARRGWQIHPDSPARRMLIDACAALHQLGHDDIVAALDDYADAIEPIAAIDINLVIDQTTIAAMTEKVIIGTILGDNLLSALRQLAQENASRPLLQHSPQKNTKPKRADTGSL
jgi:DNA-binding transcriptional MerR regulator